MNMKKLMILLLSVFTLYSCKNDVEEVDWTVDTLAITSEGNQLQDAGDGNLKMVLPTEFSGVIKLNVESNNPWIAEVSDITIQEEQWITLSSAEGTGNGTFDINIAPNNSAIDRIGSVVVTTTGNIPVKKTITLIQGNTDDMLSIGFDGIELPEGVTVKEGLYGSWNMVLPIDFSTDQQISVAISSTANPSIEITYPEGLPTDWLQAVTTLSETSTVTFTVTENTSNEYREALVTFTSKSGEVEVKKTLTVSQLGVEDVEWGGEYFQGSLEELTKAEIILPSTILSDVEIAKLKNITANNIELPEQKDDDWFTVKVVGDKVLITTIKENLTTNKENVKELVLKSKLSKEEFKISVRQCMNGYGVCVSKNYWSIVEVSANCNGKKPNKWFDEKWGTSKQDDSWYDELGTRASKDDLYVITFDLGPNTFGYNNIGLMPRLQWTQQAPKSIKVETSSDNKYWVERIAYVEGNCFTEGELSIGGTWNDHYNGIVHWCEFGEVTTHRYLRLSFGQGFQSQNDYRYISLDEIFVSDRSNVVTE